MNKKPKVGVANAVAYTGDIARIVPIQASIANRDYHAPVNPRVNITGEIGGTMLNSIEAALAAIRLHEYLDQEGCEVNIFIGNRLDGESAGVAIYAALWSALHVVPLNQEICCTGIVGVEAETVERVEGIVEKLECAREAGMKGILLPIENMSEVGLDFNLMDMYIKPCMMLEEVITGMSYTKNCNS